MVFVSVLCKMNTFNNWHILLVLTGNVLINIEELADTRSKTLLEIPGATVRENTDAHWIHNNIEFPAY